jgi:hypothetical protein
MNKGKKSNGHGPQCIHTALDASQNNGIGFNDPANKKEVEAYVKALGTAIDQAGKAILQTKERFDRGEVDGQQISLAIIDGVLGLLETASILAQNFAMPMDYFQGACMEATNAFREGRELNVANIIRNADMTRGLLGALEQLKDQGGLDALIRDSGAPPVPRASRTSNKPN